MFSYRYSCLGAIGVFQALLGKVVGQCLSHNRSSGDRLFGSFKSACLKQLTRNEKVELGIVRYQVSILSRAQEDSWLQFMFSTDLLWQLR